MGLKLQIFSDLHLDVYPLSTKLPRTDAGIVIVAGDVQQGARQSINSIDNRFSNRRILAVGGNHTFYGSFIEDEGMILRDDPRYLENQAVVIDGVRFLGATLWTDYALNGQANVPFEMLRARRGLNDFRRIGFQKKPWRRFLPSDALAMHLVSLAFLEEQFRLDPNIPTVVITHHAPHPNSIAPQYVTSDLNSSYASDLTEQILRWKPLLWVHGHVHSSFDYHVGKTRIVCNPHGYGDENPVFDPEFIVEI